MTDGEYGIRYVNLQIAKLTGMDRETLDEARRHYNKNREKKLKRGDFYKMCLLMGANQILCGGSVSD